MRGYIYTCSNPNPIFRELPNMPLRWFGLQVTITFYNPPLSLHEHFKRPLACVLA